MTRAAELAEVLAGIHRQPGISSVRVDLTAVDFLDAGGIGALVVGYRAARTAGAGYALVGARGPVLTVLRLTGVLDLLGEKQH
jgi:anti-anti-sigma factor